MLKKESGISNVGNVFITLTTLVVVLIMIVATMGYMENYDIRDNIDVVAREYILRMETQGYLTPEAKQQLIDALMEVGVTDISLEGTTEAEVEYGEQILLCISGKVQLYSFSLDSLFEVNESYEWTEFELTPKCSTAKK